MWCNTCLWLYGKIFLHQRHVSLRTIFSFRLFSHFSLTVKGLFPEELHSLKAVEFVGDKPTNTHPPVGRVALEVHIYQMCNCHETVVDGSTLLQAETILLPNLRFEGIWERLVSYLVLHRCQARYLS